MKQENVIKEKSYKFAVRAVRLSQFLVNEKREFVLSKQILRSGTAVGALVREAEQAESRKDFIHKLAIALKEANETEYWIDLIKDTDYIDEKLHQSLYKDCNELIRIITAIIKTTKGRKKVDNSLHSHAFLSSLFLQQK